MPVNAVQFGATGSDENALYLKVYSGSFIEPWREATHLWDDNSGVINRQTVESGKEFQHLRFADIPEPDDFDPGNDLVGQGFAVDEVNITPDKYLVAHQWIRRDDMKKSHFQVLPRLARSHASRIGRTYDKRLFILAAAAARQTTAVTKNGLTVHKGGNRVTRSGGTVATAYPASTTGAANFRADLRTLGRRMDEDQIPAGGRRLWFRPDVRESLLYDNTNQVFSRDFNSMNDQQMRKVMELEGFGVVGFPNASSNGGPLPDEDFTGASLSKYRYNFTSQASDGIPAALALCVGPDGGAAVGVKTYENVQHVVRYYDEKLCWLVASFLYVGCGILDPWCAGSVEVIT